MRISDWSSDVCSSDLNIDAARRATCAHPCRERHRRRRPAGGKSMKVIVLGAGVVGVTSAWYLAEAGHEVVLVDRQPGPALETRDRKSTRLNSSTNAHLVCRLLIEKKNYQTTTN